MAVHNKEATVVAIHLKDHQLLSRILKDTIPQIHNKVLKLPPNFNVFTNSIRAPQSYPQKPSSPDYGPRRNSPAPFYVVSGQRPPESQGPPQNQGQQQQYPQRDTAPSMPMNPQLAPLQTTSPQPSHPMHASSPPPSQFLPQGGHPSQGGQRPQSTYSNHPQELATSAFDSPVNQHGPNSVYSASLYSQDDTYSSVGPHNQQAPPSQQQYNAYVPPNQSQQQPAYEPPAPPQGGQIPPPVQMNAGYPVIGQDARQTLPSQGAPPVQSQYKPYQRPGSADGHPPSAPPSAPPGAPQDFYRQSTAY